MAKVNAKVIAIGLVAVGLLLGAVALVSADDETTDLELKVRAPLDAVDCTPGASTISLLGQTIDINTVAIDTNSDGGSSGDSQDVAGTPSGEDGGDAQGSSTGSSSQGGCAALAANQVVEVAFASDAAPLVASAVDTQGPGDSEPEIKGPVQAVDTTNQTVTVLGYIVSVNGAALDGADDDSADGNSQPVTLDQLMIGQSVEIKLDASQLPALVATELQMKNFTNQVTVEVDDQSGQEVDDTDSSGAPVNDIEVDVTETVPVQSPAAATTRRVRKVIHLHNVTNGSFQLTGLPTGHARIQVTRTANGSTYKGRRRIAVLGNQQRATRIRLHRAR